MLRRSTFLWIILAAILTACNTQQPVEEPPTQAPPVSQLDPSDSAYPAPENLEAAYPVEQTKPEPFFITEIPTPQAGKVTITGVLYSGFIEPVPAERVLLALATIVETSDGTPQLAGYDRVIAPKALTDSAGRFVFQDVDPVRYALVIDRINESFLLNHPETGGDFLFQGEPGEILDLGNVTHPELPGAE